MSVIITPSPGQQLIETELSPAELARIEEGRKQFLLQLDAARVQGRHLIQLNCGSDRSTWKPFKGIVTFWYQGASMNGAADVSLYICPHCHTPYAKESYTSLPERRDNGEVWQSGYHVCMRCNRPSREEEVYGEVFARLHSQKWAEVLTRWCSCLGYDCDLKIVYAKSDIRKVSEQEALRPNMGEKLRRAESVDRPAQRFRWRTLMQDSNTRGMVEAIKAFINS